MYWIQCVYFQYTHTHILGSGLHHSYSLRVAAWINVEGSLFVLSVRSRSGITVISVISQVLHAIHNCAIHTCKTRMMFVSST